MSESDALLHRVCLGVHRARVDGEVYLVRPPTYLDLAEGDEIYEEVLHEAYLEGLFSFEEIPEVLCELGLWDMAREEQLQSLPRDIERLKKAMLKATFRSNDRDRLRKELRRAEEKLNELWATRHGLDHVCCEGLARTERTRHLIRRGLRVDVCETLLDDISRTLVISRPTEIDIRRLARSESWRSLYHTRSNIFGGEDFPPTEEQRHLLNWTILYEKVLEHPSRPSEEILADDDLFDGWLAEQRGNSSGGEPVITNEKIRNAGEVFIVAQTQADAQKVYAMNDRHAQQKVQSRLQTVTQRGEVAEADLPDVRRDAKMKSVQSMRKQ